MNIVILGDPNSIWIKRYINNVLKEKSNKVYIFTENTWNNDNVYNDNVKIINCKIKEIYRKLRLASVIYGIHFLQWINKNDEIDCMHIHFVNNRKLIALLLTHKKIKKIIVTFWGSDLLRSDVINKHYFKKCYQYIDNISVGSNQMKEYFINNSKICMGEKVQVVRFGVDGIDTINELINSYKKANDNICVAIGYNGSKQQNHLTVIEEISKLPKKLREKLILILPMTYGLNKNYYFDVKQKLDSLGINYKIYTEYLNSTEMSKIELEADIFIHAQKSDALSASVQEFLAAGTIVLNPKWIEYEELKDNDVFYYEYNSNSDISEILLSILNNGISEEVRKKLKDNINIMVNMSSWRTLIDEWNKLYI